MRYGVRYEWDGEFWFAQVPSVPGCHTQGRSIGEAQRRIREALGLYVDDAEKAELEAEFLLPTPIRNIVKEARVVRERARAEQEKADKQVAISAAALREEHLSVRDIGELLEFSHQRIQQILSAAKAKQASSARQRGQSRNGKPASASGRSRRDLGLRAKA